MATQVIMPKLSPTMEEGQLARWLKKEGDKVSMGEPLAEIDTDKATMEMQALGSGVLRKILIQEGESAPLGQLIAIIGEPDEDISALTSQAATAQPAKEFAKEDAKAGTSIAAFMPRRRKLVSTLRFNLHFAEVAQAERRELAYRSTRGEVLTGVLQLPIERSSTGRHPVIVWAYPDQEPSMSDSLTRLNSPMAAWLPFQYLLTRGFAVFHAPLSTEMKHLIEPIDMVTDAVLPWLDVLEQQAEIIAGEYGFFGHSNAGYVALALEAMTTRFKAIVASSTFPDLAAASLSSAMDKMVLDCAGQVIQADRFYYEDTNQPYSFGGPFWRAQQKFIRNSPLYRMNSAATPMLLIEGEFDFSPRQMESVFSILYGLGIPVEMAHYWGEGHVISSPGNIKDMWERTDTFFRKYMRMN